MGVTQIFCCAQGIKEVFTKKKAAVVEGEVFFSATYVLDCHLVSDLGRVGIVTRSFSMLP